MNNVGFLVLGIAACLIVLRQGWHYLTGRGLPINDVTSLMNKDNMKIFKTDFSKVHFFHESKEFPVQSQALNGFDEIL